MLGLIHIQMRKKTENKNSDFSRCNSCGSPKIYDTNYARAVEAKKKRLRTIFIFLVRNQIIIHYLIQGKNRSHFRFRKILILWSNNFTVDLRFRIFITWSFEKKLKIYRIFLDSQRLHVYFMKYHTFNVYYCKKQRFNLYIFWIFEYWNI